MSLTALSLVLFAALLHAGWNAMLKAVDDRALILAAVSGAHAILGLGMVLYAPAPHPDSWPFILTSVLLHYGYYLLLFASYRHGDLSQVYPISRGMAPAVVAISSVILIGEVLDFWGWMGLIAISCGVGILALQRGAASAPKITLVYAVALGFLIAAYSVADGIGVRRAESPFGYMGWLFLLEFPVPLVIALNRVQKRGVFPGKTIALGLFGGVCAVVAYGIAVYVSTFAPLGAVSAVRESSVIFAALIGIFIFGERPMAGRLLAAVIVASGIMALAASG